MSNKRLSFNKKQIMPYLSEKIIIANTEHDRRVKMSPEQKIEAIELRKNGATYLSIAKVFGVSKSLIMFICKPEALERNLALREERGGWKQYYSKESRRKAQKETRSHKQGLFLEGKIKIDEELNKS